MPVGPYYVIVYGRDEHSRRRRTRIAAVDAVVVESRPDILHLFERHALADVVGDARADDGQCIAVADHFRAIGHAPVTRHDVGSTLLVLPRYHHLDDIVQGVDQARQRPALVFFYHRISQRIEQIAGTDDV